MPDCPDSIRRLIEHFDRQKDQVRSPDYNETLLRIDFINPMFRQLGWDIDNTQGFAEQYREVVHEDRVRVAGANKAPDYSFRIGGVRKFFLETKKPFVNIKQNWEPAYQIRRYGWSAKLAVSLLTDFEELAIYDCRVTPKMFDKPSVARREYITYTDYPAKWHFLDGTFSKNAVLRGDFDRYCESHKGRGAQAFDEAFLLEIEDWRKKLATNLALRNERLDEQSLNFAVQRIIDRIIFLRMCEDRGTEHVDQLRGLLNGDEVYPRLQKLFRDADARYNSGLFHFKAEPGRDETPDTLTPTLEVDDATLKPILKRLYYPESPYEFTMVSADILGSVYERFLGKIITLIEGHRAKVEEKPEVRKAGGVYYTPAYIVDYIVRQTVGKLLENCKSPKDAAKLKILDPACGSGSFLLGAFQHLLDWRLRWYVNDGPEKWSKGKNATIRPADRPSDAAALLAATTPEAGAIPNAGAGHWALTIKERKRVLLDNIHGVDIDYQAVEVTKLSLLLKVLQGETAESLSGLWTLFRERALPDLGKNIQCGNSLIGTDIMAEDAWRNLSEDERRRINPFDFERGFAAATHDGRFGAVIGNPPYVLAQSMNNPTVFRYFARSFEAAKYKIDTYHLFMERAVKLLSGRGTFGFIVPNTFLRNRHARDLRRVLLEYTTPAALRLFDYDVFDASVDTAILIATAGRPRKGAVVRLERSNESGTTANAELPLQSWAEHPALEFLPSTTPAEVSIVRRLETEGVPLMRFATAYFGIQTHDRNRFVAKRKLSRHHRPVVDGEHIERYLLRPGSEFVDYRPIAIKSGGNPDVYARERIGVRQIGKVPIATLLPPGLATLNTIYNIYFVRETLYDLRLVLAVICSAVGRFYWLQRLFDQKKTFPKVKKPDLLSIPLPNLNLGTQADQRRQGNLVKLVRSIIMLRQQAWASKTPHDAERLQREIDATDRRIDQLVYQLYELTDEEIRIVEAATSPAPADPTD